MPWNRKTRSRLDRVLGNKSLSLFLSQSQQVIVKKMMAHLWVFLSFTRGGAFMYFCSHSPFAHDIAIKGVENALVRQLQGVIQDLHILAPLHFRGITHLHSCSQFLLPNLRQTDRHVTYPSHRLPPTTLNDKLNDLQYSQEQSWGLLA